jgi:hypothetical protein
MLRAPNSVFILTKIAIQVGHKSSSFLSVKALWKAFQGGAPSLARRSLGVGGQTAAACGCSRGSMTPAITPQECFTEFREQLL